MTFLVTLFCWKDSPLGVVALMQLCLGDGFAEVVGRRWGKSLVWPFCKDKSVVGTLAFSVAGWVASYGALIYFKNMGIFFQGNELSTLSLVLVTFACSAVELVSWYSCIHHILIVLIYLGTVSRRQFFSTSRCHFGWRAFPKAKFDLIAASCEMSGANALEASMSP